MLYNKYKRVKKEQKKLSRKEKGSNNWKKQKKKLAKAHKKLRDARRDFLHKLSRAYSDKYDVIAVEDLDSKNLSEGESSALNRHIANHAWNEFVSMLAYKASQAGKQVCRGRSKKHHKKLLKPKL
ncbi:MAG: IS605 OrfB-like transposable element containing RNAse H-like and Zn finger domain [Candidatus Methanohalarchaeum thermophilum]|uniref:IS605 OrfB-like transposable element containing RNAse H-like and Zn finger domain n=1 Tax=Methanohalarchaeum thermophilum TaxID=1903181 RepID=A0A1Q6DSV7_METT1|nr:MAG: IS605 OrfB-like transposable element containing RNAse H-like and Zn finger domain [Candidatus Methanohalarchaeum thermophilum]